MYVEDLILQIQSKVCKPNQLNVPVRYISPYTEKYHPLELQSSFVVQKQH